MRDFEGWYRAVYPRVVTTLSVTLGSADEATEVSQEAMARAYERWSSVGGMDNPDGWVFRVALNEARRRGRRRAHERRLHAAADPARPPSADTLVELRELIDELPTRMCEVVVLRHVADLTEPMIAEVLGISHGTVSSTLPRRLRPTGPIDGERGGGVHRMTTTDVIERLDELSSSAVSSAVPPPMDAIVARADGRRRSHRRRTVLVAAAVIAAVAIVGGVLATNSTRHTRVTTTDDQDHGAGPHLVPSVWPAGLDVPDHHTQRVAVRPEAAARLRPPTRRKGSGDGTTRRLPDATAANRLSARP